MEIAIILMMLLFATFARFFVIPLYHKCKSIELQLLSETNVCRDALIVNDRLHRENEKCRFATAVYKNELAKILTPQVITQIENAIDENFKIIE